MMIKSFKSLAQRQKDENEFYQIHGSRSTRIFYVMIVKNYDFIRWIARFSFKCCSTQHISRICEAFLHDPFGRRPRKARK